MLKLATRLAPAMLAILAFLLLAQPAGGGQCALADGADPDVLYVDTLDQQPVELQRGLLAEDIGVSLSLSIYQPDIRWLTGDDPAKPAPLTLASTVLPESDAQFGFDEQAFGQRRSQSVRRQAEEADEQDGKDGGVVKRGIAVPEPATFLLLGLGSFAVMRRRR